MHADDAALAVALHESAEFEAGISKTPCCGLVSIAFTDHASGGFELRSDAGARRGRCIKKLGGGDGLQFGNLIFSSSDEVQRKKRTLWKTGKRAN